MTKYLVTESRVRTTLVDAWCEEAALELVQDIVSLSDGTEDWQELETEVQAV